MNDLYNYLDIEVVDCEDLEEDLADKYGADVIYTSDKGTVFVNENVFARYFTELNRLSYNNGLFFNRDGKISEDLLMKDIWEAVESFGITSNVASLCRRLIDVIRITATKEKIEPKNNIIPFRNGDLYITEKVFKRNSFVDSPFRLSVPLVDELGESPNFFKWLHDLFEEDDIPAFQMFLGLALTNSQKAQKSLYVIGHGGAGKSVVGVILEAMLGKAMISTPSTQEFTKDKFKIAELENKLVLYDDDMDDSALENSGLYKKLITNELYITADRKYGQPFEFKPSCKLICCANTFVVPASDTTDGFYRRLHPILIKPAPEGFKQDKYFYDKIRKEINYITYWAIQGLYKLIENDWVIPESERTKNYITQKKLEANPLPAFMADCFEKGNDLEMITSADIFNIYKTWCHDNSTEMVTQKALSTWLIDNAEKYDITHTRSIPIDGKHMRGFKGIKRKSYDPKPKTIKLYVGASEPQQ